MTRITWPRAIYVAVMSLVAIGLSGCGSFRLVKDRYKEAKTVAIVQAVGERAKGISVPLDLNFGGHPVWERIVTNDAVALQDFLKTRGFNVIPLDELVKSDAYRKTGEHLTHGDFAPEGMRMFTPRGRPGAGLSFMTANRLAKELGVDAVVCLYEEWKDESAALGTKKLARTVVKVQMVDQHSNEIWLDQDFSDSTKAVTIMGVQATNTDDFVGAYNEAFQATLGKMKSRLDAEVPVG